MANDKKGKGALFENDKQGNANRPDYTGECTIDGRTFRVAAWNTTARSGKPYISLAFSDKVEGQQQGTSAPASSSQPAPAGNDDDIPF